MSRDVRERVHSVRPWLGAVEGAGRRSRDDEAAGFVGAAGCSSRGSASRARRDAEGARVEVEEVAGRTSARGLRAGDYESQPCIPTRALRPFGNSSIQQVRGDFRGGLRVVPEPAVGACAAEMLEEGDRGAEACADVDVDENGGEARELTKLHNPSMPSRAERENHNLTHLPFRSWCDHCVRGRGEGAPHFRAGESEGGHELHMDFCFMGEQADQRKMTILVARERRTRMTLASVAPSKAHNEFLAGRIQAFLRELGLDRGDLVVKTDQEPAMRALIGEVARRRAADGGGRCVVEHSPVGESQSNGVIERAVKSVEGQVRVAKLALEARVAGRVGPGHAAMSWLVEYAAFLLNRFEVGKDGRTAYERNKGKPAKTHGIEFGEIVWWRRRPAGDLAAKLSSLWESGVFLGVKGVSGELIIGTAQGIWRTRTVRRKPAEERWELDALAGLKGVPWNMSGEETEETQDDGVIVPKPVERDAREDEQHVREEISAPRAFNSKREDYEKHGYTRSCPGCRAMLTGTSRQKHTAACRARMEKELQADARVKAAKRRRSEFADKAADREGQAEDAANDMEAGAACGSSASRGAGPEDRKRRLEPEAGAEPEVKRGVRAGGGLGGGDGDRAEAGADRGGGAGARGRDQGDGQAGGGAEMHDDIEVGMDVGLTIEQFEGASEFVCIDKLSTEQAENLEDVLKLGEGVEARVYRVKSKQMESPMLGMPTRPLSTDAHENGELTAGSMEVNVEEEPWDEAFDEVDGDEADGEPSEGVGFDPQLLSAARLEEIQFMQDLGVWEQSSAQECLAKTGRKPTSTKWVDVDKGRDGEVLVRSRLVARDFKVKGDSRGFDVFAATPPLELKRLLFRMARTAGSVGGCDADGPVKLMFVDVKKAHLNGEVGPDEHEFIQLPAEAGGGVGKLRRWLYGMRPAASAWEEHYAARLAEAGFERGRAATTAFVNRETGVRVVVWGDDFTFLGRERHLRDIAAKMAEWYQIKIRAVMGHDDQDDKEVRILNRVIRWGRDRIEYEADDKHVTTIMGELGFDGDTKGLDVPIVKEHDESLDRDEPLGDGDAKRYRGLAATINYLASDRPDLQFTASVLGRTMARPTQQSWANLKRAARYLKRHSRVVFEYPDAVWEDVRTLVGYSDSDWAGCKQSRRSVSGGMVTLGGTILKSWANRQATIALSSGEAEFHSATKAAAELLAIRSMMRDLGWETDLRLFVDASVAEAMANRQGIGKVRHLEVRYLWLQDTAKDGTITVRRIGSRWNPADVLTKPMSFGEMLDKLVVVRVVSGPS